MVSPDPATTEQAARNEAHNQKMRKIKEARDKLMATKTEEKGLIVVHTGAGKGKSSSGFGMIMRCIAHQMPCAVVQFIKGTWRTGERDFLKSVSLRTVSLLYLVRVLPGKHRTGHAISPRPRPDGKKQKS